MISLEVVSFDGPCSIVRLHGKFNAEINKCVLR